MTDRVRLHYCYHGLKVGLCFVTVYVLCIWTLTKTIKYFTIKLKTETCVSVPSFLPSSCIRVTLWLTAQPPCSTTGGESVSYLRLLLSVYVCDENKGKTVVNCILIHHLDITACGLTRSWLITVSVQTNRRTNNQSLYIRGRQITSSRQLLTLQCFLFVSVWFYPSCLRHESLSHRKCLSRKYLPHPTGSSFTHWQSYLFKSSTWRGLYFLAVIQVIQNKLYQDISIENRAYMESWQMQQLI